MCFEWNIFYNIYIIFLSSVLYTSGSLMYVPYVYVYIMYAKPRDVYVRIFIL